MDERYKILFRTVPFLVIGVLAFIIYLVIFVDIPRMIVVIQNANIWSYLLAAFFTVFETFFFSLSWFYLLLPLSVKVPFRRAFTFVWIGVFADLLIPAEAISGEVAKTYLMSKEPDINTGKVVASLITQRLLGTITTIFTLIIGFLGLIAIDYNISMLMLNILVIIITATIIALIFLILICIKEAWTQRLLDKVLRFIDRISRGRFKLKQYETKIIEGLKGFYESLRFFGSKPVKLIKPVFLYLLAWGSSIGVLLLVFSSIGYLEPNIPILVLKVAVVHTLLMAIKSIPIGVPAEVGLSDIVMATLFTLFGIPLDISAAVTLLTRILTVWLKFFIGFIAVQWFGVKSLVESGLFAKAKN